MGGSCWQWQRELSWDTSPLEEVAQQKALLVIETRRTMVLV